MIYFTIGRSGHRQSELVYRSIRSLPESEKAFLIVPDQFTYETERKILEDKKADLRTEVLSLKRLAYRMESSIRGGGMNVLSREAEAILIKRAITLCGENLGIFRSVMRTQGFCEEVMDFIDEMKKGGLRPEDMLISSEDGQSTKEKTDDIKKIYEKYLSLIPEGYISSDEYFSFISEKCGESDVITDSHFYFDGFYSFDKSEYPLISLIMRKAKSVTFSFITGDENFFDCARYTLNELYEIITEYSLEYTVKKNTDNTLLTKEGIFLEENLMSYDPVRYAEETDRINLIEAEDMIRECDYAACEINRLIREEGYRYSDFQVICTDKSYFPVLRNVFERHCLEFFIDENKEISSTSAVRAFLYIIDMLGSSYTTTELISFAKSGFSGLSDEEYMLLENYVLEMGIKGKMWENDFTRNTPEESYDVGYINSVREKLITPIKRIRENVLGYENVSDFVKRLTASLEEISFEETIDGYIQQFVSAPDYETANIYSQINNKILLALSELESFFGEEYLSSREIYDLLSFCLSGCRVGIIPSRVDAVSVGDVIRSSDKNCRVMFVMGCSEGLMPSKSYSCPILSDRERMNLKGFTIKSTSEYLRKRENFVYYKFLTSPKDKLYLSCAKEGENYPSVMFERIREIFPYSDCPDVEKELTRAEMIDTRQYAFYKLTDIISSLGNEEADEELIAFVSAIKNSLDDEITKKYVKVIEDGNSFENNSEIKDKKTYRSILSTPLNTSVSMLESYGRCPFLFFMDYIIKPKERRIRKVRNTDLGSVLHRIVEEFSKLIINKETDIEALDEVSIAVLAEDIAKKVLSEYKDGMISDVTHGKYLYRKLITSSVSAIKELVSQLRLSEFSMTESEARFGPGGKFSSVVIRTPDDEEVYIRGIIDRIDFAGILGGKYLKIIDYKSSKRNFDLSKTGGNISFQLPAYALAVKEEGSDIAGVFYFKLNSTPVNIKSNMSMEEITEEVRKERKLRGLTLRDMDVVMALDSNAEKDSFIANVNIKKDKTLSDKEGLYTREEFDSLLRLAKKNMGIVSKEITDGNIPITPYRFGQSENACTYCEYGEICKFNSSFGKNSFRNIEKMTREDLCKEENDG